MYKKIERFLAGRPLSRIWIIGNAPEEIPVAHLVREDDVVIRFNSPNPSCPLKADILFIANGYDNLERLKIDRNYLKKESLLIFRYTPLQAICLYWKNRKRIRVIGYIYRFLSLFLKNRLFFPFRCVATDVIDEIDARVLKTDKTASSGFIILHYLLDMFPDRQIIMHNFKFKGWEGHPWELEEEFVKRLISQKKVEFITPSAD